MLADARRDCFRHAAEFFGWEDREERSRPSEEGLRRVAECKDRTTSEAERPGEGDYVD